MRSTLLRTAAVASAGLLLCGCARHQLAVHHHEAPGRGLSGAVSPPTSSPAPSVPSTEAAARPALGPVASWLLSERAFYRAGQLGEPDYGPLVSSFAPSSPALESIVSFLITLEVAGVVAPSSYRLGAGRLLFEDGHEATVTGCSYDTGSRYRSSRLPAPASLGGGAGFTAYQVRLLLRGGRWLVWSIASRAVSSDREPGPCEGF